MISLATDSDRVLFFDFQPGTLQVRGLDCRFHLYTTPGAVFRPNSHRLVLKGVDGVVFVADSQAARLVANVEALENLEADLASHGYSLDGVPFALQYNKRDLPESLSVADLDAALDAARRPRFQAVARTGLGVFDTLKSVARQVLDRARGGPEAPL